MKVIHLKCDKCGVDLPQNQQRQGLIVGNGTVLDLCGGCEGTTTIAEFRELEKMPPEKRQEGWKK